MAAAPEAALKKAPRKAAVKEGAKDAKAPAIPKVKKKPAPKAKDERYTLTEARAAASGLAARAGLKLVRAHTSAEPEEKAKTRQLKKSPLTKAQLEKYREILLQKRAEVASDVTAMQSEAFGANDGGAFPQHPGDQGSDEYEQSLSLGLAESQRKLLMEIKEALVRIDDGAYGICALTGGPIGRDRLDATPWTKLSLEGAREQDRQNYYQ
jgi:RNA polymerase-binding protein DksA